MSSRAAEKERRRLERREQQRLEEASRRRRRVARFAAVGVAVAVAITITSVVVGRGGDSNQAFGPHQVGVVGRAAAADVPPSAEGRGAPHVHPNLYVFVRGRRIAVPAGIGLDRAGSMAALHTHGDDGTVHVEGMRSAALGQLFQVWGVALTPGRMGPFRSDRGERVAAWVDGARVRALATVRLRDRENVTVSLGSRRPPIG